MRLEHNANVDHAKREDRGEKPEKKFSRFKNILEENAKHLTNAIKYSLIAAAVVFTVKCGNPSDNPNTDADANDSHEGVLDGFEDTHDEDLPDIIEEGDVPETDTIDEDVEDEELPPLECPSPVEETAPDLNDVFEANVTDYVTTTGGEVSADTDLHMSMIPTSYNECPRPGEGGYELVCVDGGSINIDGEYYLMAENVDALLPAASSIDDVCATVTEDYPLLVYAGVTPEIIKNAVYDFGSYTVDSIAGFSMDEPGSFYFDVDGTRNDVVSMTFTPSASGIYPITFMRDAAVMTFDARSFDGRDSEATNSYNADMVEGSSKPLYVAAVNSTDEMHYSVDGIATNYGNSWYDIIICTRLSSGVRTDSITLALDDLEGASTFEVLCPITDTGCGCMGEEVTLSLSDITSSGIPIGGEMIAVTTLLTTVINSPDDIPEIQIDYTYSGSGSIGLDLDITVGMTLNIDGTNVCTGGTPFHEHYRFYITAWDPATADYVTECGGPMDSST